MLIVDDEVDTRDYLTTALQQCQAEVMTVASAQETLDAMQEAKIANDYTGISRKNSVP